MNDAIFTVLRMTLGYLDASTPSPRSREYRARAESYARVLESWKTLAPSSEQRAALAEVIEALHASVVGSTRTRSLRARPYREAPCAT